MLLIIAVEKIPAGTRGYADSYVIQLASLLCRPIDVHMFSVDYALKVGEGWSAVRCEAYQREITSTCAIRKINGNQTMGTR